MAKLSGLCQMEEFKLESAGKNTIPVRDDVSWHAVEAVDVVKEQLGHLLSSEGVQKRHQVREITEFVNHHHQAIGRARAQKPFDEVY